MSKVVLAADPAGTVLSSDPEDKLPFLRPGENTEAPKAQNEYVILMDGNSITRHDGSPQIRLPPLRMAASSAMTQANLSHSR